MNGGKTMQTIAIFFVRVAKKCVALTPIIFIFLIRKTYTSQHSKSWYVWLTIYNLSSLKCKESYLLIKLIKIIVANMETCP